MFRIFTDTTLLIASHNQGKVKELASMFAPYRVSLVSAAELGIAEPEETGTTFQENAILKASYYSKAASMPALADDSGLAVEALGGQPGVYSARWAEEHKDFGVAMNKIEQMLAGHSNNKAAFVCALSLYWPDGYHIEVEGEMQGILAFPARGEKGFGYDPIFIPAGHTRTCAEMLPEEKNAISHRAKAFNALIARCFTHD